MEVKVKCVVSLIAYLNELNWFVQVHTCVGENTRPRSLIPPTGPSTRLISFPWAPLANCRIIWQRTLYEHILLNRCKFSFCYPSVSATFGTAALYQKQLLWCSWTGSIPKGRKDEMMEKCVVTSQTMAVWEVGLVLFWLQRKMLHLKDSLFYGLDLFLFLISDFFFLPRCPEALKPGNDFLQTTGVFSFILSEEQSIV